MRLGMVMKKWRLMEERTVRDVAKEVGTSAATLNRMEHGMPCDSGTMAKILLWLISAK